MKAWERFAGILAALVILELANVVGGTWVAAGTGIALVTIGATADARIGQRRRKGPA